MSTAAHDVGTEPRRIRARLDRHGLAVEDEVRGECVRFDAEGRWIAWHRGSAVVRRALLHEAITRHAGRPVKGSPAEAAALVTAAAGWARRMRRDLESGAVQTVADGAEEAELLQALARAAAWDQPRHDAERAEAAAVFPDGIPILPPHRQRDVVVEPARGCPNGRCTFCAFYRGRRFEVLDDAAFDAHLARVLLLWGAALASRTGVFLGSASAASLPDAILLRRLARLEEALGRRPRGVAAFLDPDRSPRRDGPAWARLVSAGLRDVTVGLETGDAALREASGKSGDVSAFIDVVRLAKGGGARVAVSVLVGLGGPEFADRHREASSDALLRMDLDAGDLVYLSPLSGALTPEREAAEVRAWRDALNRTTAARVSPYGADAFVALA